MRLRNASAAAVCALVFASALVGQTAPTPPAMPKHRPPGKVKSSKPALDFSGTWQLDEKASQNVSNKMVGAVLLVKQNGNRIWIEPVEQKALNILAEQIVVDGRLYEKVMGKQKATLWANWGTDDESLWLQVNTGKGDDPQRAIQRSVWRLRESGNTWTRQTWTINGDQTKMSFYVFRKRPAGVAATPSPSPAPKPTPGRKP